MKLPLFAVLLSLAFSAAHADGISSVTIFPTTAKAGQEVKITVAAEGDGTQFCGLRIEFGDGENSDIKIASSEKQFPVTVGKTYAKPGTYTVKARGKTVTTHARCPGSAEATIAVAAAASGTVPSRAVTTTGPTCPEGYALQGKPGKAGDFTCKAGKGAKKPEKVMDCGDKLEYFQTKSALGCRQVKSGAKK
jgi:hypothetical protein